MVEIYCLYAEYSHTNQQYYLQLSIFIVLTIANRFLYVSSSREAFAIYSNIIVFELHIYYIDIHITFVIMGDIKTMTLHLYHKNNKQILYEYNTLCNRYALLC
jgi:hypothetical protein